MKVVVAIDSFKGCMSSVEAGKITARAIVSRIPDAQVEVFPLADGGEGTLEALTSGMKGEIFSEEVTGPLGERVMSRYAVLSDGTAVLQMSDAAGLTMVPASERNPMNTTTYGVGKLIVKAADRGARKFIIGIGGSATNDAGLGMLTALGAVFKKQDGTMAGIYGRDLADVAIIETDGILDIVKDSEFYIACDVENPLCGPKGCSKIFGPQKGATPEIISKMDHMIRNFAALAEKQGITGAELPGAGAAGGLGYAFASFLGAKLQGGVELVLKEIGIEKSLLSADVFITGEGRMDGQTAMGKAPIGAAALAKKLNPSIRTIGVCGCAGDDASEVNKHGIDAYFPILHQPCSLDDAMNNATARKNLYNTVQQIAGLLN